LKPGGRVVVSDIVLLKELPDCLKSSVDAYVGCVAGAALKGDYLAYITNVGFTDVKVNEEAIFAIDCMLNDPMAQAIIKKLRISREGLDELAKSAVSVKVSETRPE
jgi:arsenite methyltransferase